jgi:hypothetical protein
MIPPSTTPKRGSSSQSLNHLLNFTLPPRQSQQTLPRRNRRTNGSSLVWNKERECTAFRGERHHLIISLCRVCQRAVPVCYESNWRLYCALCRPGHVCFYWFRPIGWELIAYRSSFFQWHDILQVIIPRKSAMAAARSKGGLVSQEEGSTTCPICLAPPTAPRMTKCGHVRT